MSAGWVWFHPDFAMVCDLPAEIHREQPVGDAIRRLHNTEGPAVLWHDGVGAYFVHGVYVQNPSWIIDRSQLTVARIQQEQNAEVRRAMIGMYGADRYLRDAKAVVVHSDECGRLLRLEQDGDESIVMVEVVNSTPEPVAYKPGKDEHGVWHGKRFSKIYTLRVPPTMQTARAAVAWTFSLSESEYRPLVES